jgi:hypothetical protein
MPTSQYITDPIILDFFGTKLLVLFRLRGVSGEGPTDGNNGTSAVATVRSHYA